MYIELIAILTLLGYLYFKNDFLSKITFQLIKLYTLIEVNIFNKFIKFQRYWNQGLKIDSVYYYNDINNNFIKKDSKKLKHYTKNIKDDEVIYILYRYDNINYIDIVDSSNGMDYNIDNSLNLIKDNCYKGLISACSVTISNDTTVIYDEVEITGLFLRLFHNAINRQIMVKSIKIFMINNFNLSNDCRFKLTIVDSECNIIELNEDSSITINNVTDNYILIYYN